ncbi:phosphoenolpyruvate carboxykinase (ATP) [Bacillus licheniformis]|nr:phosphoenolpyruvate carboxykinase (ATP) [Bacillus licheniformis]
MDEHGVGVFLVNTGWTGGGYGTGERMSLAYTRAMVQAAIEGELDKAEMRTDRISDFIHLSTFRVCLIKCLTRPNLDR